MRNEFSYTEEILDNQNRIKDFINGYQLKNLPCATVDSKDGVVLEVNCFPAASEIYSKGFVNRTVRSAAKMACLSDKLNVLLITEDFSRHPTYLQNADVWFREISDMDIIASIERKTFREFEKPDANLIISNSDLRFEEFARRIIDSLIPCFPSPYAGWWIRSKTGTCISIENVCSKLRINPRYVQPDYRYVNCEGTEDDIVKNLKEKTEEMTRLYPCGVFVKQGTGTQGYGCMHISESRDYDRKEVKEVLSLKRGFRGSEIKDILLQKCVSSSRFPLQFIDEKMNLVKEEERPAELYFVMVADNELRADIHNIFIRIGPANSFHNLNRPGEVFKNLKTHDIDSLNITLHDLEAASLTAKLSYAATDIQVENLKLALKK